MDPPHGYGRDLSLVPVAIFWDYENCSPRHSAGYTVIDNIRQIAHNYGTVKLFKAYLELSEQNSSRSLSLLSELQSCGVSLTDCPHNGRKDVADKMMIVDMLTYAIDTPAPATIILISGDRDFVYAVSILRFRRYNVVVIAPPTAHSSLKSGASDILDWDRDVLGKPLRDRHARHVSADVPSSRDQWPELDTGIRGYAVQSPNGPISNPTVPKSNRRHSCNARPSALPPAIYSQGAASDAAPATLRVPVPHSSPPTPHHHAQTLRQDAPGPFPALRGTPNALHVDSNVRQSDPNVAASNANTPISPGMSTSAVFSDTEPASSIFGDSYPDGSSNSDMLEFPATTLPISDGSFSSVETISMRQSGQGAPYDLPTTSVADTPPHLSVRMATPDTPAEAPDQRRMLDNRTFALRNETQKTATLPGSVGPACSDPASSGPSAPTPIDFPLTSLGAMESADPFQSLVDILDIARRAGQTRPLRSHIAIQLTKQNDRVYQLAGVTKFKDFAALAKQRGIVELGGQEGGAWISLLPAWHDRGRRPA